MSEIKNCPFCNAEMVDLRICAAPYHGKEKVAVHCLNCACYGKPETTEEAAISAWNTRPDGWISTRDESPEFQKDVLILVRGEIVTIGFFGEKDLWYENALNSFKDEPILMAVTHWMPLPCAPLKEKEA